MKVPYCTYLSFELTAAFPGEMWARASRSCGAVHDGASNTENAGIVDARAGRSRPHLENSFV